MAEIKNASLVFKDKNGNIGRIKGLTDADVAKIQLARDHVALIVDRASGKLIEATTSSLGVVQLASTADVTAGTAGKVVDAAQLAEVKGDLSKVYKYKGSVATFEELPTKDVLNGDVYNVEAAHGNFPAGTNYAAIVSTAGVISWDALGGSIDTSDFALKSKDNTFTGKNTFSGDLVAHNGVTFDAGTAAQVRVETPAVFTYTVEVPDLSATSGDSEAANKKYVDEVAAEAAQIVEYSATQPEDSAVSNNRVVFFPATDLLS